MAEGKQLASFEEDSISNVNAGPNNGYDNEYDFSAPGLKTFGLDFGRNEDARADKEKITDLQAQVVRLRNDLEKGETVRQQLEYELAVSGKTLKARGKEISALELELSRRDAEHEAAAERAEAERRERERKLKEERAAAERAGALQRERLEEVEERLQRLRKALEEKMEEARQLALQKSNFASEVDVLEGKLEDLRQKFVAMSEQCQGLRAEMAERNGDLAALRSREAVARQELQAVVSRCRQLEEEAERGKAGQLEQRFNGELVQLKLREAESQLQAERHAKAEAVQLMEEVSRKLHEMETAWEEEKNRTATYREEFERMRADHLTSRSSLTEELEEKRRLTSQLQETAERQRDELEALKEAADKLQRDVDEKDERHRKLALELALLLDKAPSGPDGEASGEKQSRARRNLDAEGMLDQLRRSAAAQRKVATAAREDLSKLRLATESATREARSLRDQVRGKEKALLLESEKNNNSVQELRTLKKKLSEADRRVSELRAANSEQKRRLEKMEEEAASHKEELQRVRRGRKAELEDRNHFLADLNHRLSAAFEAMPVSGAVASRSFGKSSGGDSSREATWTELKGSMSEQLAGVLSSLERQNDKIRQLEECVRGKERTIDDLKQAQEAQMHKYDSLNQSFSLQKKELEEHYNKLIQDMQTKSRQSQALADQAWEKINATGSLQVGLESECASLRSAQSHARSQIGRLRAAVALLLSLHLPLARRAGQLCAERRLLTRLVEHSFAARRRLAALARILHRRPNGDAAEAEAEAAREEAGAGVARFRTAVIAVIAAHRLRRLAAPHRSSSASASPFLLPRRADCTSLAEWLDSDALQRAVDDSLSGLDALSEVEPEAVGPAAVRGVSALLERAEADFFADGGGHWVSLRRADLSDSLAARLARGLALGATPGRAGLADSVLEVEQGVLALSRRLVAADNLAAQLREDAEALEERLVTTERRVGCIQGLRRALEEAVPSETHRRVLQELASSRSAEAEAQDLLQQQAEQLASLAQRVEELSSGGSARDSELREAAEMLSRSRVELKRREQSVRQLTRQGAALREEKAAMEERVDAAEQSVAGWRFERDLCLAYLTAVVQAAAEGGRQAAQNLPDVRALLEREPNFLPSLQEPSGAATEHSAQVIACRNAVRAISEVALRWQRRATTADEKVAHYRRHVALLKRELAAACARAVDCPEGLLDMGPPPPMEMPLRPPPSMEMPLRLAGCPAGGVQLEEQSEC